MDAQTPGELVCPSCRKHLFIERSEDLVPPLEQDEDDKLPVEPDNVPPDTKTAFVFCRTRQWEQEAVFYFSAKEYFVSRAMDGNEAIQKLRLNRYDAIVFEDRFSNADIFREINSWPGQRRRHISVMLIGDKAKSREPKMAFTKGANIYININDFTQAVDLFEEGLRIHEQDVEPWRRFSGTEK